MKPQLLKTLTLASLLSLSLSSFAQVEGLPKITRPAELSDEFIEGVLVKIPANELEIFTKWANNAKKRLSDALNDLKYLHLNEQLPSLKSEVESVVREANGKQYQMLMRYTLNRGLFLVSDMEKESQERRDEMRELSILKKAVNLALKYAETDLEYQKRIEKGQARKFSQAIFGEEFFSTFIHDTYSILDASAQFRMKYKLYEFLMWDLSQDEKAIEYAEMISDLYRGLSKLDEQAPKEDRDSLRQSRELNRLLLKLEQNKNLGKVRDCGVSGSVNERIKDCISSIDSTKGNFELVSRVDDVEIWRDSKSKFILSPRLTKKLSQRFAEDACKKDQPEFLGLKLNWELPAKEQFEELLGSGIDQITTPQMNGCGQKTLVIKRAKDGIMDGA